MVLPILLLLQLPHSFHGRFRESQLFLRRGYVLSFGELYVPGAIKRCSFFVHIVLLLSLLTGSLLAFLIFARTVERLLNFREVFALRTAKRALRTSEVIFLLLG